MSDNPITLIRFLILGVLISGPGISANATNPGQKGFSGTWDSGASSTIFSMYSLPVNQDKKDGIINFQVNSEINYLFVNQFKKTEAKQFFLDAQTKEISLKNIIQRTDSLRKVYTNSNDQDKEKIATQILDAEKKMAALSDEVPALYEKARGMESQYWQAASNDEKTKFKEKIQASADSVRQRSYAVVKQDRPNIPDTITFYRAGKAKEVAAEPVATVLYKIQVGTYKTKLPETAAKAIKKLEILRKVEKYKDEKGMTVLTTGNLKSYQEALTLLNQVKLEGIKNATITAFNNGKKITNEEAKKLTNETSVKP